MHVCINEWKHDGERTAHDCNVAHQQVSGSHEFILGYQQKSYTASPWGTVSAGNCIGYMGTTSVHASLYPDSQMHL